MFALIRRVGAETTVGWDADPGEVVWLWAFASVLFGVTFFLVTVVTETRTSPVVGPVGPSDPQPTST
jgi:hypothetical protein